MKVYLQELFLRMKESRKVVDLGAEVVLLPDGTRLTDEVAAQIAEAGQEAARAKRRIEDEVEE